MGLFDRLRAKKERLYRDPETGETSWVPVEHQDKKHVTLQDDSGRNVRIQREERSLTRKEQFPPPRQQPWQTPRGKQVIKGVKGGIKKLDNAIVEYNRKQYNKPRQRISNYSTQNNYNPFGNMFDMGMNYPRKPRKKQSSKTKYKVIGDKAYPIAGTGKKKKRKSKHQSSRDWDPFGAWGGYKL